MAYNIHPIFVHFPIAFLVAYSVIVILPFRKWFPKVAWKHIELVLLFAGVLGGFVANMTGEVAEHLTRANHKLVETHATFALISMWSYGLILAGEILTLLSSIIIPKHNIRVLDSILSPIHKILTINFITKLLAIAGLVAIVVTGLLGGVIVYGVSADPLAPIVLKFLGITVD